MLKFGNVYCQNLINLKMGNETSFLSEIEIEEKSIEVSDFWSHHSANIIQNNNVTNLSVFVGDLFVNGPLWTTYTPLEKNSKNLMIYRHPYIIKYISSWQKGSKFYLALEEVKPLAHVLSTQSSLQMCIGLNSILKALCFLHDKALVSHNNVCTSTIYVTKDGTWKLGGMEYLTKFNDLTEDFIKKSKTYRYSKAIDPNEEKNITNSSRKDLIDVFAFGNLVCELLKSQTDDEIITLTSFRDLAKIALQNINILERPKLCSLLSHEFFNHDFIIIHSFLIELPLKSDEEKNDFFQTLNERLKKFPENIIASQLGELLLSRMVLLNNTAQKNLLPFVLCPRLNSDDNGLFSENNFKKFLAPRLLEIISVRDAQIRLLLLNYFSNFIQIFSKEELQSCILPELLVGVKDTNDLLVSVTLRTLADLVPILGANIVIGGKRAKLFNDGRPMLHNDRRRKIVKSSQDTIISNEILTNFDSLPERPRPDGEEEDTSTDEVEVSIGGDLDNWEDWDINEQNNTNNNQIIAATVDNNLQIDENQQELLQSVNENITNISKLDIKNQLTELNEEIDFFQDMEPIIEASTKYVIEKKDENKFNLNAIAADEDGWIEEEWE